MAEHFLCPSDQLAPGGKGLRFQVGTEVGAGGTARMIEAFAVRYQGKPYAYLNRCGHVPVELDWQPGEFFDFSGQFLICATHGALYGPESGRCISGRCAGRGLVSVPLVERDGSIFWLDKEEGQ